jgi:hypothetical protein
LIFKFFDFQAGGYFLGVATADGLAAGACVVPGADGICPGAMAREGRVGTGPL